MNVQIVCSATGYGILNYHWEKLDSVNSLWKILPLERQIKASNMSTLVFQAVNSSDNGIYRCIVINDDGKAISLDSTISVYGMLLAVKINVFPLPKREKKVHDFHTKILDTKSCEVKGGSQMVRKLSLQKVFLYFWIKA